MNKEELIGILKPHLVNMIDIINDINVPMEGSLFFDDQVCGIDFKSINDTAYEKALTLVEFASDKKELLEIGFNSGFSSLLFLSTNKDIKVTAVDICLYPYTFPCFQYLKNIFGDRIDLVEGDSTITVPSIIKEKNFDSYFIDGGHSDEVTGADFRNIINDAIAGATICADDYNFPTIRNIVNHHVSLGQLEIISENDLNVFLKVRK